LLLVIMAGHGPADAQGAPPAGASPQPPVSNEPQLTTASYADWTLRCQRAGAAANAPRLCEIDQTVQAQTQQGQQGVILRLAFGRPAAKEPFKLTILVPVNIALPSAPRLSIDDKDPSPVELAWRRCIPAGCVADVDVSADMLKHWRAQTERGRVQIKDSAGREVALPFSFRGLAQALDALAKS
jgi:invasion protein IalB